ncbi:IF44L-like protein, partial [Mya arenaria]
INTSTYTPYKCNMAGQLTDAYMDQLETWIGTGPKTFTLLYKITRDGCDATIFHQQCDNQGPTVTVLYNTSDSVFGGYAGQSWHSRKAWINDNTTFLYQLRFSGNEKTNKFPFQGSKASNALFGHTTYGPTFGGGHDLHAFAGKISNNSGTFALNGHMTFHSYDSQELTTDQINNGHMDVTELEVYKVTGCALVTAPGCAPVTAPGCALVTAPGCAPVTAPGCASVTALECAPVTAPGCAPVTAPGCAPVTAPKMRTRNGPRMRTRNGPRMRTRNGPRMRTRNGPRMRTRNGPRMRTRNGSKSNPSSLLTADTPFNPATPITPESPGFIQKPGLADKVHCVLFVLEANTVDDLPTKLVEKMNSFQKLMNQKGMGSRSRKNVSSVFRKTNVEKAVDTVAKLLGLPRNNVLPVKNYENEVQLESATSALALLALRQALYFTEDFLEDVVDKKASVKAARGRGLSGGSGEGKGERVEIGSDSA